MKMPEHEEHDQPLYEGVDVGDMDLSNLSDISKMMLMHSMKIKKFGEFGKPTVQDGCLCHSFDSDKPLPDEDVVVNHNVFVQPYHSYVFKDVLVEAGGVLTIYGSFRVKTLRVAPGGKLILQGGKISFRNDIVYTDAEDPGQFGGGLVVTDGTIHILSPDKSMMRQPFVRLSHNVLKGQTVLKPLFMPENWRVGDLLCIGDTTQKFRNQSRTAYVEWYDEVKITAMDETSITVEPIQWDHRGSRIKPNSKYKGATSGPGRNDPDYLYPMLSNLTRENKMFGEEFGDTTLFDSRIRRPHVFINGVCDVYIEDLEMNGFSKTTTFLRQDPFPTGTASSWHLEPNKNLNPHGRYSLHLHHVTGPIYNDKGFVAPYVSDVAIRNCLKHGLVIHHTSDGVFKRNIVAKAEGAGFFVEGGTEVRNIFEDWCAVQCTGDGFNYRNPPLDDPGIVSTSLVSPSKSHWSRGGAGVTVTAAGNTFKNIFVEGVGHTGFRHDSHSGFVYYPLIWGDVPKNVEDAIKVSEYPGHPMTLKIDPRIMGNFGAPPPTDIVVMGCPRGVVLWGVGTGERHADENNDHSPIPYPAPYEMRNILVANAQEQSLPFIGARNARIINSTFVGENGTTGIAPWSFDNEGFIVDSVFDGCVSDGGVAVGKQTLSMLVKNSFFPSLSIQNTFGGAQAVEMFDRKVVFENVEIATKITYVTMPTKIVDLAMATSPGTTSGNESTKHLFDFTFFNSKFKGISLPNHRLWSFAQHPDSYPYLDSNRRWGFPGPITQQQKDMVFEKWDSKTRTLRSPNHGQMGTTYDGSQILVVGGYLMKIVGDNDLLKAQLDKALADLAALEVLKQNKLASVTQLELSIAAKQELIKLNLDTTTVLQIQIDILQAQIDQLRSDINDILAMVDADLVRIATYNDQITILATEITSIEEDINTKNILIADLKTQLGIP